MHENDESKKPLPAEVWAERKGMLPEKLPAESRVGTRVKKTFRPNPKTVLFRMAKAHAGWPEGKEVTESDFDDAVEAAGNISLQ